jgi:large subunit ribosomal protein L4
MEATIYNREGKKTGEIVLPDGIFGVKWNADLVHQVVVSMDSNRRQGTADSKGRGEVRGGGKKPWKQKGTGRARHGSSRSPLWKGGGVTHGPLTERNYTKKINRQTKLKALFMVLSQKVRDNEILFVDEMVLKAIKTKDAGQMLKNLAKVKGFEKLAYRRGNRALVTLPIDNEKVLKSFRNLPIAKVENARNLNPLELLNYQYLIVSQPKESVAVLVGRAKL